MRYIAPVCAVFLVAGLSCDNGKSPNGPGDGTIINGITFVSIPGGSFQMGDVEGIGWPSEKPVHTVTVSDFEMGIYEVTNARYAQFLNDAKESGDITPSNISVSGAKGPYKEQEYIYLAGNNPSFPDARCWIEYSAGVFSVVAGHENWPVEWVTWYGSKAFAVYYGFDLPTEAEWEYACRGGRQYTYGTDDGTISTSKANYYWNTSIGHPVAVGSYQKNPYGLFDMSGNVYEWCHDVHSEDYYSSSPAKDPTGAQEGQNHVIRGGSWGEVSYYCRAAYRMRDGAGWKNIRLGFRVVRRDSSQNY